MTDDDNFTEACLLAQAAAEHTLQRYNTDLKLFSRNAPVLLPMIALSLALAATIPGFGQGFPLAVFFGTLTSIVCVLLFDQRLAAPAWIAYSPTLCALAASLRHAPVHRLDQIYDTESALWKKLREEGAVFSKDLDTPVKMETCIHHLTVRCIALLPIHNKIEEYRARAHNAGSDDDSSDTEEAK